MKAVVYTEYGPPDVLHVEDVDTPVPAANDVLVTVHAAALNPVDWHFVRGTPVPVRLMVGGLRRPKRPRGVGGDFAGTIAAIGCGVTRFEIGDAVLGYSERGGALAEHLTVPADRIVEKPERVTFAQAAGVPLAGLTALQLLRKAGLRRGQRVLVVGAAGGIGSFVVQLAKAQGAHVTGVQSTTALDLVRSLGADRVIDYTREDFTAGGARYDIVVDNVCNHALADVLRIIEPGGVFIPNGGGSPDKGISMLGLLRTLATRPFVSQRILFGVTKPDQADLQILADMIQSGSVTPVVDRTYPLSAAADAMRHLEAGHAHGKIVLTTGM